MGSSRKHKKHKDKDKDKDKNRSESSSAVDSNAGEQKPLRLVLKVPTAYSQQSSPNHNNSSTTAPLLAPTLEPQVDVDDNESPPKLMAFSGLSPQTSQSSSKKLKKKKSKKKHRKHSHHSSGHHSRHRHRSHRHRHHGSCSHHLRQSQDSTQSLPAPIATSSKSPQKNVSSSSSKSSSKTQFQQFLSHLYKQLQRKDIQQFFAWPVSDMIAPGYSSIISQPMDLSTLKKKVDNNEYETLLDFKADVKLICDNCQKYNRPETVYYKAATKLWHYTRNKLLNKESLIDLMRSYPGLSSYELGFHFEDPNNSLIMSEIDGNRSYDMNTLNAMTVGETLPLIEEQQELQEAEEMDEDGMTPEQILEEAKKAAQMAADRLSLKRPNGANLSFLRQRNDGSTTLSIIGNHSYEQNINLEALVGKLVEGSAALPPFKEHESNIVKPIETINESPFCSYLPHYDTSKATLNEEDSALLLSTYGDDEMGLQYAESITQFSQETDYVLNLVDSLLDILTHGQHQKIAIKLREKQKTLENETNVNQSVITETSIDTNLSEIDLQLNETGGIIGDLQSLQYQRLSSTTFPIKPSAEEEKLANQLTTKLTDIIGTHSYPKEVTDVGSLRKAMGIKIKTEK
ncbi:bromodomain-containing protein 7-like [Oppia nitens]|uniref:bromodomain-containing protein 7-like n=1 Tax=Oppia nitens TaxID=1686743 RepID=UPI0023DCD535|nr:bromodomain-containing protein 7-like [Oppia nitens]